MIQVYLQIIPKHLALTVKLQAPCNFHNHPQYCLHPPRCDEGNIFIPKVVRHLETYSIIIVKKSELPGVIWSKISRKWKDCQKIYVFFSDCRTIMTGKRQKICLFFIK